MLSYAWLLWPYCFPIKKIRNTFVPLNSSIKQSFIPKLNPIDKVVSDKEILNECSLWSNVTYLGCNDHSMFSYDKATPKSVL